MISGLVRDRLGKAGKVGPTGRLKFLSADDIAKGLAQALDE